MNNINRIFTAVASISIAITMVGCNQEIPNEDVPPMDSSLLGISIGASSTEKTETTTTVTTIVTESTTSTEATTTEPIILGYKLDELTDIGKELYNNACEKYRNMLIDCYYGVDLYDYIIDESGKRYFRITDDSHNNIDAIFEDWHTIFNDNFDNLINSTYLEYEGSIYGYTAIQQVNTNYRGTHLEYYSVDGNEITFKATGDYSSGEKIFKFSMEYYPSTHEWRVSKFTMPY